jgi:hypothetical protein
MKSCAERCVNCDAEGATVLHPLHEKVEKYREIHPYLCSSRPRLFCSADCLRQNCREWEIPILKTWVQEFVPFKNIYKKRKWLIHLCCKTVDYLLSRNSTLFKLFFASAKKGIAEQELELEKSQAQLERLRAIDVQLRARRADMVESRARLMKRTENSPELAELVVQMNGKLGEIDDLLVSKNELCEQIEISPDAEMNKIFTFWLDDMELMAPNFIN